MSPPLLVLAGKKLKEYYWKSQDNQETKKAVVLPYAPPSATLALKSHYGMLSPVPQYLKSCHETKNFTHYCFARIRKGHELKGCAEQIC